MALLVKKTQATCSSACTATAQIGLLIAQAKSSNCPDLETERALGEVSFGDVA
jgi:hypothetical protein